MTRRAGAWLVLFGAMAGCQSAPAPVPPPAAPAPGPSVPAAPVLPAPAPSAQFDPAPLLRVRSERERNAYACWMRLGCERPPRLLGPEDQAAAMAPDQVGAGLNSPYGPALAEILLDEAMLDVGPAPPASFTIDDAPFARADLPRLLARADDPRRWLRAAAQAGAGDAHRQALAARLQNRAKALGVALPRLWAARGGSDAATVDGWAAAVLSGPLPPSSWTGLLAAPGFVSPAAPAFVDVRGDGSSRLAQGAPPGCFVIDPASQVIVLGGSGADPRVVWQRHRAAGCGSAASRSRAEESWVVRAVAELSSVGAPRVTAAEGFDELMWRLRRAAVGVRLLFAGTASPSRDADVVVADALGVHDDAIGLSQLVPVDARGAVVDEFVALLLATSLHAAWLDATVQSPAFLDEHVRALSQAGLAASADRAARGLASWWARRG